MSLGRPRNHGCRISDEWTFNGLRTLITAQLRFR